MIVFYKFTDVEMLKEILTVFLSSLKKDSCLPNLNKLGGFSNKRSKEMEDLAFVLSRNKVIEEAIEAFSSEASISPDMITLLGKVLTNSKYSDERKRILHKLANMQELELGNHSWQMKEALVQMMDQEAYKK